MYTYQQDPGAAGWDISWRLHIVDPNSSAETIVNIACSMGSNGPFTDTIAEDIVQVVRNYLDSLVTGNTTRRDYKFSIDQTPL